MCREFNPVKFDAEEWVCIAKGAGMKYIVFVPKHHDGFSLWDTKATDFNIMNTPYAKECIQTMVKIAGRNGNYLLDMAPKPDGSVEDPQIKLFSQIGDWMKAFGESIYQTQGGPYLPIKGEFASTRKEN